MPLYSHHEPQFRLASHSPGRAALLHNAGYTFRQQTPPFQDPDQPDSQPNLDPADLTTRLALQKAQSLADAKPGPLLIVAADTVCVDHRGYLIGKPADRDHARLILKRFVAAIHRVVTGVALLRPDHRPITFADSATVALAHLTNRQLDQYLETDLWQGKAGAYNLFERQNAGWPILTIGDPSTIVGLPMARLAAALARFDIHPATTPLSVPLP